MIMDRLEEAVKPINISTSKACVCITSGSYYIYRFEHKRHFHFSITRSTAKCYNELVIESVEVK